MVVDSGVVVGVGEGREGRCGCEVFLLLLIECR